MPSEIVIQGARQHNLKNISLKIPRHKITVITGLSGSGKSSLAFDTIYAEGQRRYVESLSSYARQFLERLEKPDVDHISGLTPSISIDQKHFTHNPRSTVATVTEVYDFLRLLYSKLGDVHCYKCGRLVGKQSVPEILRRILELKKGEPFKLLAPLVRARKGEYKDLFRELLKKGYSSVRVDGRILDCSGGIALHKAKRHDIDVMVDTLRVDEKYKDRLEKSLTIALGLGKGACLVLAGDTSHPKAIMFSAERHCPNCGLDLGDFTPNMFSFNSPYGACPACRGLGRISKIAAGLVIKDESKPILKGAISEEVYFSFNKYVIEELVHELKERFGFDLHTPYRDLPGEVKDAFFWGSEDITGLLEELQHLFYSTHSEVIKEKVRRFIREDICHVCNGGRLRKESLGVRIGGKNIVELCSASAKDVFDFIDKLRFSPGEAKVAEPILREIRGRLKFLVDVGLHYLTLDRTVNTLGGGELQRIRLARQIGVGLAGVLYVLDEPTIGLHPRDNERLLKSLEALRGMKNTVVIVEHDEATIRKADYVVDLGPAAGTRGGAIVGKGCLSDFKRFPESLTFKYLNHELKIALPRERKDYQKCNSIWVRGAEEHNLKKIDARFPLGCFICVTGVSGSGKSTLVHDILFQALHNKTWKTSYRVGRHKCLEGTGQISAVVEIDQSPIGRSPRSNPATYTDIFTPIRNLFSQTPEARLRSYSAGRFSFNTRGGRCEACGGEGFQKLEMSFLPDLTVQCEVCGGKRYNEETLNVRYKGKNIAEVLDLSIDEAYELFANIPRLRERLSLLRRIGLGYLKLGQSSTTLSGGEAQRIKLAFELGKKTKASAFYILDEPTTGLHFADVSHLLQALFELRDEGHTVVVIEHNLDVIKMADYIIDLGPEGGNEGGHIVASGSPEEIARSKRSYTGSYLRNYLN